MSDSSAFLRVAMKSEGAAESREFIAFFFFFNLSYTDPKLQPHPVALTNKITFNLTLKILVLNIQMTLC